MANEKIKQEAKDEVAKWDETDSSMFKSKDPIMAKIEQPKVEDHKENKTAGDIKFGGHVPSFGNKSGPPKFAKSKNEKIVNEEEFPDLGDALAEKTESKGKKTQASNNNANNRFERLQGMVATTNAEEGKPKTYEKREYKPKKQKDEFFGNFRSTNKDIVSKESEKTEENTESKPIEFARSTDSSASGPPKFSFTNKKKDAMTMAKAQEEALKAKEELAKKEQNEPKKTEDKPRKFDDKPRRFDDKPRNFDDKPRKFDDKNKKPFNKDKKSDKFVKGENLEKAEKTSSKDVNSKPKAKKPKVAHEKAELADEWNTGSLEDMLK